MSPTYASAGGSAVVSTDINATVAYGDSGAIVGTPATSAPNTTVKVHVPIASPQTTLDALSKVSVECDATDSAQVNELWVYFGKTMILDEAVSNGSTDFDVSPVSSSQVPDANPYGIDVTMEINFPSSSGTFTIYSVTLAFGS